MSKTDFLSKQNVAIIWDVLMENEVLKNKSKDVIAEINSIFKKIITSFYENEKQKANNLIELNKKFISLIINYVNKTFNKTVEIQNQQQNKIIITPTPQKQQQVKELITFEELQTQRLSDFDKQLAEKQKEFTNAITLQIPETPNFSDNIDTPLSELEKEVKKMMDQRNYDVEQINKSFNGENVESWLKPVETSIKNEKIVPNIHNQNTKNMENTKNTQSNKIKYIKIEDYEVNSNIYKNEVIDLNINNSPKKHISWADENVNEKVNLNMTFNETENSSNESQTENIFKKIKLLPGMLENTNVNVNVNQDYQYQYQPIENYTSKINNMENEITKINAKLEEMNNILIEISKTFPKK